MSNLTLPGWIDYLSALTDVPPYTDEKVVIAYGGFARRLADIVNYVKGGLVTEADCIRLCQALHHDIKDWADIQHE